MTRKEVLAHQLKRKIIKKFGLQDWIKPSGEKVLLKVILEYFNKIDQL